MGTLIRTFGLPFLIIQTLGMGVATAQAPPDPLALLRGVAAARESIRSGIIEIRLAAN